MMTRIAQIFTMLSLKDFVPIHEIRVGGIES